MQGKVAVVLNCLGMPYRKTLCLMANVEGELRFVSGVVCFPQRWTIGEKVGMNMETDPRSCAPFQSAAGALSRRLHEPPGAGQALLAHQLGCI